MADVGTGVVKLDFDPVKLIIKGAILVRVDSGSSKNGSSRSHLNVSEDWLRVVDTKQVPSLVPIFINSV